ncbi:helix-turn-helix domain-containing protein [Naumannella huperziae]
MQPAEVFAKRLKGAVRGHSVRRLAKESGWGRSTVHDWLSGTRVPSAEQVDDLLEAAEVPPQARSEVHRLRDEASSQAGSPGSAAAAPATAAANGGPVLSHVEMPAPEATAPDDEPAAGLAVAPGASPATPGSPEPPAPARSAGPSGRPVLLVAVALLGALLIAGAAFWLGQRVGRGGVDAASPELVPARIANTQDRGVVGRALPTRESDHLASFFNDETVFVVCLLPNGEPITDDKMGQTRTVWALLSNGVWINDLYLDLDRSWGPPGAPPPPLRFCR